MVSILGHELYDYLEETEMQKFIEDIRFCLENHYKELCAKDEVYVSSVDMTIDRTKGAPLWMNMKVNNEFLACDISNTPNTEGRFLEVSFFWRDDKCNDITYPSHARRIGSLFWNTINCQWPVGYANDIYRNHGEFRLQKIYDKNVYSAADVAHEIERVFSLLIF